MAPKRSRGQSSGSYDAHKFVSAAAQERYITTVAKRRVIPERGIDVDRIASLVLQIRNRGWEQFTKQPEAAVLPIVREFYTNVVEHDSFRVFVRGKRVAFDRATINRYYGLANIDDDQYSDLAVQANKWDVVLENLAIPGTIWKTAGTKVLSFPANVLTRDSKVWHYFVGAKLMPVTHFSDVFRDRALLIYAIQNKLSIDVGNIVHREILRCANSSSMGLFFPSMITGLCKAAGVQWERNEEWVPPIGVIDFNVYFHMKDRIEPSQGAGSSSQAPPQPPPPSSAVGPPPATSSAPGPPPPSSSIEKQLHHLQLQNMNIQRDVQSSTRVLRKVRTWFLGLEHRQDRWEQYQSTFHEALAHNFALLADNAGIDVSHRRSFPHWDAQASMAMKHPEQGPGDDDDDDDGDADEDDGLDEEADPMHGDED